MPKEKRKVGIGGQIKGLFFGRKLKEFNIDGKHVELYKTLLGHKVRIDGRTTHHILLNVEPNSVRIYLRNVKKGHETILPKLAERIAKEYGANRVVVETWNDQVLHNSFLKNGYTHTVHEVEMEAPIATSEPFTQDKIFSSVIYSKNIPKQKKR